MRKFLIGLAAALTILVLTATDAQALGGRVSVRHRTVILGAGFGGIGRHASFVNVNVGRSGFGHVGGGYFFFGHSSFVGNFGVGGVGYGASFVQPATTFLLPAPTLLLSAPAMTTFSTFGVGAYGVGLGANVCP